MLYSSDMDNDDDDDLLDSGVSGEIVILRELESHPGYALFVSEIKKRLESQQATLNNTDPDRVGFIGRHQGVIKVLTALIPVAGDAQFREDIIGEMIADRQKIIAQRKRSQQ